MHVFDFISLRKDPFSFMLAQHVLSYRLIKVPSAELTFVHQNKKVKKYILGTYLRHSFLQQLVDLPRDCQTFWAQSASYVPFSAGGTSSLISPPAHGTFSLHWIVYVFFLIFFYCFWSTCKNWRTNLLYNVSVPPSCKYHPPLLLLLVRTDVLSRPGLTADWRGGSWGPSPYTPSCPPHEPVHPGPSWVDTRTGTRTHHHTWI